MRFSFGFQMFFVLISFFILYNFKTHPEEVWAALMAECLLCHFR